VFRGIFDAIIDTKGRTSLPARLREELIDSFGDERFFVTNTKPVWLPDGSHASGLTLHPYNNWLEIEGQIASGAAEGLTSAELDAVQRWILAPAVECTADKLGRFLVPPHLRKTAELERDVLFIGLSTKTEIWSQAQWSRVRLQDVQNFPVNSSTLTKLRL
jgi:MraZ protein